MLIRLSGTEPGTEKDRRKVKRGGGGGGTSKQLKFSLPSPAQNCFRVCLSILQKVDHNRGVSALTMLIRVKHLLCIFFSSASPTKSIHRGNKGGCGQVCILNCFGTGEGLSVAKKIIRGSLRFSSLFACWGGLRAKRPQRRRARNGCFCRLCQG